MAKYISKYSGERIDRAVGTVPADAPSEDSILVVSPDITGTDGKKQPQSKYVKLTDIAVSSLNIQNGKGTDALQQPADPKYNGVIKAAEKNPYAKVLETTLTDTEAIGASGDYAVSLGGNSSAQGKRSLGAGTSSVAKGAYSHSLGDNTVTTTRGTDSTAIGYQTTTDAPASFADGSYTVVLGQKYVEGMFDPSAEPGQPGESAEPGTTPTDTLEMDGRRGEAGHASGFNSYVSGFAAYTDGVSNVADGHISKASGRSNRAWSYLSKVDGKNSAVKPSSVSSSATGEGSWTNGDGVQIIGAKYAYGGGKNISIGDSADYSFAYGENLAITAPHQVRFGKNSENLGNDIFTVSNGRDSGYPNDAFTIKSSGEVLIPYTPTSDNGVIRKIDLKDYAAISNLKNYDYVISNGIYAYQSKKADDIGDPKGSIQQNFTNLQLTKLGVSAIQQAIGSSPTNVMSQKAVTDSLNNKVNYTDISNGLTVVDGKVKANIAKIQDSDANEFAPDENGVVTIPDAAKTTSGLVKVDSNFGLAPVTFSSIPKGTIAVAGASDVDIGNRTNVYKPITPYRLNLAVKAALTDDKRMGTETSGTNTAFTDTEKDRACEVLGASRKLYRHYATFDILSYGSCKLSFISLKSDAYSSAENLSELKDVVSVEYCTIGDSGYRMGTLFINPNDGDYTLMTAEHSIVISTASSFTDTVAEL